MGLPCDVVHGVKPERAGFCGSGGKKAFGGSHSSTVGLSGGVWGPNWGITRAVPLLPGSVEVTPGRFGPARTGPASSWSGGFGWRQRETR